MCMIQWREKKNFIAGTFEEQVLAYTKVAFLGLFCNALIRSQDIEWDVRGT